MVQIEVMASSPTYGGAGSIALVGDYLAEGLASVGEGMRRIDVHFLLTAMPKAPTQADDDTSDEDVEALMLVLSDGATESFGIGPNHPDWGRPHELQRQKGSSLVFRRSAGRVDLRLVSSLSELDVFGRDDPDPETFATAARELVEGLDPLGGRLKKDDDVDLPRLTAHLQDRLALLPGSPDEFTSMLETLAEKRAQRWESMSVWEFVDVDWSLFSPRAREVLDNPFYWDPADAEAPHGNDTGFDVLTDFLEQRPADPLLYVEQRAREWGYGSVSDLGPEDAEEYASLLVATAFAELKLTGQVTAPLRDQALHALEQRALSAPSPACDLLIAALRCGRLEPLARTPVAPARRP